MLTKKDQIAWHKNKDEKKLSKKDIHEYRTWLFLTHPSCQICGAYASCEAHHAVFGRFGADKDDRTLVAVCHPCHHAIHHGDGVDMSRDRIEAIGRENWRMYQG